MTPRAQSPRNSWIVHGVSLESSKSYYIKSSTRHGASLRTLSLCVVSEQTSTSHTTSTSTKTDSRPKPSSKNPHRRPQWASRASYPTNPQVRRMPQSEEPSAHHEDLALKPSRASTSIFRARARAIVYPINRGPGNVTSSQPHSETLISASSRAIHTLSQYVGASSFLCQYGANRHHGIGTEAGRGSAAKMSIVPHRVGPDGILAGRVRRFWLPGAGGQILSRSAICIDAVRPLEQALGRNKRVMHRCRVCSAVSRVRPCSGAVIVGSNRMSLPQT